MRSVGVFDGLDLIIVSIFVNAKSSQEYGNGCKLLSQIKGNHI